MPEQSVVGVYDTMAQAEGTVRKLDEAGFPIAHVSIVSQSLQSERELESVLPRTTHAVTAKGFELEFFLLILA